jgi:tetratricopeptide (TPR) repeat protein
MAKYTRQDVEALALSMQNAKDEGKPFAVLMGAGCSYKAGIPLADGLLKLLNDSHHGARLRGKLGCDTLVGQDYGAVMGKMPIAERKAFFDPILKKAGVNWGHIALAGMMKAGFVGRVLTFNFDAILARACGINGLYPAIYDFGVAPSNSLAHLVMPSIIHLHGQGHGAVMKNSSEETEKHATEITPLLKGTLDDFGILVVGYSGESDKVFPKLVESYSNQQQLWWCEHKDIDQSKTVKTLLDKSQGSAEYLKGVDFDAFMIDLAQELKCFPPDIFVKSAEHLLSEIAPILEPPTGLQAAARIFALTKEKFQKWKEEENTIAVAMQTDLLAGNPEKAEKAADGSDQDDPAIQDMLAWAEIVKGVELTDLAREKDNDEALLRKAVSRYEAAVKINSNIPEAFNNWGITLVDLAQVKGNDERLFREAFSKYEASLKIKSDYGNAFYNWGVALTALARAKGNDEILFREAVLKYDLAHNINPDDYEALYNWGVVVYELAKSNNDLGLFSSAAQKFESALKIRSDLPLALNNWGQTLSELAKATKEQKFFTDSFSKFEAALKFKPDHDLALFNWGTALSELAVLRNERALFYQAIEKYEKAIELNPSNHAALYNWGVALTALAEAKNNDANLFREAISKYEAALKIKPDKEEALNNWGVALSALAKANNNDETLWREAILKFEAALNIRPDSSDMLENCVIALIHLYHLLPDNSLLVDAEQKASHCEKIEGKANFNLACIYALQNREQDCRSQLLRCRDAGTLPNAAHLLADQDFKCYRGREWFQALLT